MNVDLERYLNGLAPADRALWDDAELYLEATKLLSMRDLVAAIGGDTSAAVPEWINERDDWEAAYLEAAAELQRRGIQPPTLNGPSSVD